MAQQPETPAWRDELQRLQQAVTLNYTGVPREAIAQVGTSTLYHYHDPALNVTVRRGPLLLCYALINQTSILDLTADSSFVRRLLLEGFDVFLIDWGQPSAADRYLALEDYICYYLKRHVSTVKALSGRTQIDLAGICQGGLFSLCYAALYPRDIRHLITLVTPVNFHSQDNHFSYLLQQLPMDALRQKPRNIDGAWLAQMFLALKPFRAGSDKYLQSLLKGMNNQEIDEFFAMEAWLYMGPDLAYTAFSEFVDGLIRHNRLYRGQLLLGQRLVDLKQIQAKVLNVMALYDHIVPPDASQALAEFVPAERYQTLQMKCGHIGMLVSPKRQQQVIQGLLSLDA